MILAALLSMATPAVADQDVGEAPRECRLEFEAVIPSMGATDVPIDTLVRLFTIGDECGNEEVTLQVTEGEVVLDPFTASGVSGTWARFSDLQLKPDTDYRAEFWTSNNQLVVEFSTGNAVAPPPQAPTFQINTLNAVETDGQIGVFMDSEVEGTVQDLSGLSTLRVQLTDRFDRELATESGNAQSFIYWVEESLPAEVCMSATVVSASGAESEAVTDCAEPSYTLIDNPLGGNGCNCSSGGMGYGWAALALLPLVVLRRRRA